MRGICRPVGADFSQARPVDVSRDIVILLIPALKGRHIIARRLSDHRERNPGNHGSHPCSSPNGAAQKQNRQAEARVGTDVYGCVRSKMRGRQRLERPPSLKLPPLPRLRWTSWKTRGRPAGRSEAGEKTFVTIVVHSWFSRGGSCAMGAIFRMRMLFSKKMGKSWKKGLTLE